MKDASNSRTHALIRWIHSARKVRLRGERLALVPCLAPGDRGHAHAMQALASNHHAVLLANHGPVVAGTSLANAQNPTEELDETARLHLILQSKALRLLTPERIADLRRRLNSS